MTRAGTRPAAADIVAGGATTAIGAAFLIGSLGIERETGVLGGPYVVPTVASAALVIFGLSILASAILVPPREAEAARRPRPTLLPFAIVGGGLAYAWLISAVGYLPATLIIAPFASVAFGGRGVRGALLPGLAAAIGLYLVFFLGLGIYDPPGRLLDVKLLLGL